MTSVEQENLAIAKSAYAASARGDWKAFLEISRATDTTELHEAASLPYGGVYIGVAGIARGATLMAGAWDDFRFQVIEFAAGGEIVIAHVLISGTGKKTGKSFSMPVMELWRFREGQVVEFRPFYFDTHRCVECFG
jgi:ketosteroid isomerase-like protein